METAILVWLLMVPLFLSLAAFVVRGLANEELLFIEIIHLLSISIVLVLGLVTVLSVMGGQTVTGLGGWLLVDSLGAVFLLIVVAVGFLVGLYSIGYIRQELRAGELEAGQVSIYYGLFNLFLFTMLLTVTSNNIIIMWVAVEATTLCSTFLVGINGKRSSLEAAWKYVIICTVGVAFGLYGTVLVYSDAVNIVPEPAAASLWTEIVQYAPSLDPTLLKLAFVFILIGFGTKAGIFPMHAWLPDAHSEAPAPVSALLSGVLLNCALFVIIRFSIVLNRAVGADFTQNIFLVFGSLSIVTAALFMFVQRDLKRLLAYSSVENIGLIVLALGLGGPAGTLAALLHAINHSLVKSLMFCASGNVLLKYHSRDLGKVRGVLQVAPITGVLMLAGIIALVGAPPFNIFISKFLIFTAGMGLGRPDALPWLMVGLLLMLAVAFAAFAKAASGSVFGEQPADLKKGDLGWATLLPMGVLLVLALTLGIYVPPQIGSLLENASMIAMSGQPASQAALTFFSAAGPVGLLQVHFLLP